jgi:hypothetical protein
VRSSARPPPELQTLLLKRICSWRGSEVPFVPDNRSPDTYCTKNGISGNYRAGSFERMVGTRKDGRASHDAHLSDDEVVAKIGHPDLWRCCCASTVHPTLCQRREGWGYPSFCGSMRNRRLLPRIRCVTETSVTALPDAMPFGAGFVLDFVVLPAFLRESIQFPVIRQPYRTP